jgi:two-component system, NarL family, sensor kinase
MQKNTNDIIIFLYGTSILFLFLISIILFLLYSYKNRQQRHLESITLIKQDFEKTILNTQLEIQENTFQHISREIHDNISLSLTLAKLQLNTFDWNDREKSVIKMESSIQLLGKSIAQLSDISKSLNADIIIQQGLLQALDEEMQRIRQADQFELVYEVKGSPVFLDSNKELIIFRIIQEAFNNVIKHAKASVVQLQLDYCPDQLQILIADNGRGFDPERNRNGGNAGLKNMETRAQILKGEMQVFSSAESGTNLIFTIPIE